MKNWYNSIAPNITTALIYLNKGNSYLNCETSFSNVNYNVNTVLQYPLKSSRNESGSSSLFVQFRVKSDLKQFLRITDLLHSHPESFNSRRQSSSDDSYNELEMSEEKSLKFLLLYQCIILNILLNMIHLIFDTERVNVREFNRFGFFVCHFEYAFLNVFQYAF